MALREQLEALMRALSADDPIAALDPELLKSIDRDGFRLTSLLVKKLRFERILSADEEARRAFERDPEEFTGTFRAYNREVPPTHLFPRAEAKAFREFLTRRRSAE